MIIIVMEQLEMLIQPVVEVQLAVVDQKNVQIVLMMMEMGI